MNERIREIANAAGEYTDFEVGICTDKFLEKFAELIIRQCAGIDFRHKVGMTTEMAEAFIAKGHAP